MKKILKTIGCIIIIIIFPFIFPIIARFLIHTHLYESVNVFNDYMTIFYNIYFIIILAIALITVYFIICTKEEIKEWLDKRDFSFKFKDAEVTSKTNEIIDETTKKKDFTFNMNTRENDNKIVAMIVKEELDLANNKKSKKQKSKKDENYSENKLLQDENNKLRFFSAYNIINQKTKELLNIIYCNKSMELNEFKNILITNFKNRNKKNKNLSNVQKNEYANNKYETIKNGLQFLNIIEISDDNKTITLTS